MSGMAETEVSARPPVSVRQDKPSAHVLDIAAHIMVVAERDGIEMTVAKLHFLCYQVQGWTLAYGGRPAFEQKIYAVAEGVRIDEISTAYAPLGDGVFTLQDTIDAGIITVPAADTGECISAGEEPATQQ